MTPIHPDAARAEIMEILRTRMGTVYMSKGTLMDTASALLAFVQQREGALIGSILDEWEAAYPEDIFPSFTAADHPNVSPDRIAAAMARHVVREIRKQLTPHPDRSA